MASIIVTIVGSLTLIFIGLCLINLIIERATLLFKIKYAIIGYWWHRKKFKAWLKEKNEQERGGLEI